MAVPAWPRIVVHVDMDILDIDVKSVGVFICPFRRIYHRVLGSDRVDVWSELGNCLVV